MPAPIKLYQLVIANGLAISPYVWRIRYALAHKGLAVEAVPLGFAGIAGAAGGGFKTVPIIQDGARAVGDSWAIADYLDETYPERPLFGGPGERALAAFFDHWFLGQVMRRMFGLYVLDIHDQAAPEDQPYFRQTREARLRGATLEAFVAGREARLPELREALQPLRMTLADRPWLGGEAPNYADYVLVGGFLWLAGVATMPPLAAGDPLLAWLDRARDLYDGLGRDPRQHPLAEV
ncbi:MAG: glutathione S-transferase N-terminal domain-containing protein [Caulobacteraceae bacterium]